MPISPTPSRRHFLQAVAAAVASLVRPRNLFGGSPRHSYWFLRAADHEVWSVADPVKWSLDNRHQPMLARASEGLLKLTADNSDRIIRLVVRRCGLNLLELRRERVGVHHWGLHGLADLRPFFKMHRLAIPEIEVVIRDRKRESVTMQRGDDFVYGDRLAAGFPLDLILHKWQRRLVDEPGDRTPAPGTRSGFAWEGVEDDLIPWAALKSAWRRTPRSPCPNCDQPTILANFGRPWVGPFRRASRFVIICPNCRRSFSDDSVTDPDAWIVMCLDAEVRPDYEMLLGRRVRRHGPGLR